LSQLSTPQILLFILSLATSLMVCLFGANTYVLWLLNRRRSFSWSCYNNEFVEMPFVTIQIATYNEKNVIMNTLKNCLRLDYPEDRLEIVVVDDSTDETKDLLRDLESEHSPRLKVVQRSTREGYKAGALNIATAHSKGDFFLILDADSIPNRNFLKEVIPYFLNDERLAFVQGKIEYFNRSKSWLTKSLALAEDWYASLAQPALSKGQMILSFLGHGGVIRKAALEDAGGWEHDTITEDMDISYRVQMKGWRALFVESAVTKELIPESYSVASTRYVRHIKGPLQNLRKHGKTLVAQRHIGIFSKIEGLFQMAYPVSYIIGLLSISLTAATYLFLPGNFIESFWLSPVGFLISFVMLVTFPFICFVCSPIIPVLLIFIASPLIIAVFIKERSKLHQFSVVGTVGALLLWNDNVLIGTRAVIELLVGRKTIWIPTRKIGFPSRDDPKLMKVETRKIGNFILRITPSFLVTSAFMLLIGIGNFTLLASGLLLPALMWLISAFFILSSND